MSVDGSEVQPDLRDRILLDLGGNELTVDAPVSAALDTTAHIGFLGVRASHGSSGQVPVLAPIDDSVPMLAVDARVPSPISLSDLSTARSPDTGSPPVPTTVNMQVPSRNSP